MKNRQHPDATRLHAVKDAVRESEYHGLPRVSAHIWNSGVKLGFVGDPIEHPLDLIRERLSRARLMRFVPVVSGIELGSGFRSE